MSVLIGVTALLALTALLNLAITMALIRRVRSLQDPTAQSQHRAPQTVSLRPGDSIKPFQATTDDGEQVTERSLTGLLIVGVFSTACPACRENAPLFADRAADRAGGLDRTLAIVSGQQGPDLDSLADVLNGGVRTVRDSPEGRLLRSFGVVGFPAYLVVEDGKVIASSSDAADLIALAPEHVTRV